MEFIRPFFHKLQENVIAIFTPRSLVWHFLAISLTYIVVTSGIDWWYFQATRGQWIWYAASIAGISGFLVPLIAPWALVIIGAAAGSARLKNMGYAIGQSAALAWLLSAFYKTMTGRAHPVVWSNDAALDLTHQFHFGFFQNGVFWGWPSSHTIVAFACSLTFMALVQNRSLRIAALIYAFFVGISVSVSFHWFSDFLAGAILGTLVGTIVGNAFKNR